MSIRTKLPREVADSLDLDSLAQSRPVEKRVEGDLVLVVSQPAFIVGTDLAAPVQQVVEPLVLGQVHGDATTVCISMEAPAFFPVLAIWVKARKRLKAEHHKPIFICFAAFRTSGGLLEIGKGIS